MKRVAVIGGCMGLFLILSPVYALSQQVNWLLGMRLGLSIASGGPSVDIVNPFTGQKTHQGGTSAGFQFGPTGEVIFSKDLAIVEAFNINTQSGTPIEWQNTFKYYFSIPKSKIKPYADAGFSLWFFTGGPYVSIPFGGGALFEVAPHVYIPADVQFGPIFVSGSTQFVIEITTGIRYEFH